MRVTRTPPSRGRNNSLIVVLISVCADDFVWMCRHRFEIQWKCEWANDAEWAEKWLHLSHCNSVRKVRCRSRWNIIIKTTENMQQQFKLLIISSIKSKAIHQLRQQLVAFDVIVAASFEQYFIFIFFTFHCLWISFSRATPECNVHSIAVAAAACRLIQFSSRRQSTCFSTADHFYALMILLVWIQVRVTGNTQLRILAFIRWTRKRQAVTLR